MIGMATQGFMLKSSDIVAEELKDYGYSSGCLGEEGQ